MFESEDECEVNKKRGENVKLMEKKKHVVNTGAMMGEDREVSADPETSYLGWFARFARHLEEFRLEKYLSCEGRVVSSEREGDRCVHRIESNDDLHHKTTNSMQIFHLGNKAQLFPRLPDPQPPSSRNALATVTSSIPGMITPLDALRKQLPPWYAKLFFNSAFQVMASHKSPVDVDSEL